MKRLVKSIFVIAAMTLGAHAATAPTASLLGVGTVSGSYGGSSTFTLVDQYNVPASLIVQSLQLTGSNAVTGNNTVTGNNIVTGNQTTSGLTIYTPNQTVAASVVQITTFTALTPTSTFVVISATGAIVWGAPGVTPYNTGLSTITATAGQFVILEATSSVYTVTITSNAGNGFAASNINMWLGAGSRLLDNNHIIGLIFDGIQGVWKELFYR